MDSQHTSRAHELSTQALADLLLERSLRDYADTELSWDEPLVVDRLFDGPLSELGYSQLDWVLEGFSEEQIRKTAARVFDTLPPTQERPAQFMEPQSNDLALLERIIRNFTEPRPPKNLPDPPAHELSAHALTVHLLERSLRDYALNADKPLAVDRLFVRPLSDAQLNWIVQGFPEEQVRKTATRVFDEVQDGK